MDEEVKTVEELPVETPVEAKQEELPLAEEKPAEETPLEAKAEEPKAEEKPPEEAKPDWKERELKAKHRQLQEAKRREAEKDAKIAALEAIAAKFNQPANETPSQTIPVDEVDKRANELLAQRQYIENCNKTAQDGEAQYKEQWKDAVSNLELLGGFDPQTMNGLLATDAPAKVLFELGKNPDHYHRIMSLPLEKRIIEMGKIAMQAPSKPVSNAPAPVNPVGGRAAPAAQTLTDELNDDKWYAIRAQQRRKRWEEKNVRR